MRAVRQNRFQKSNLRIIWIKCTALVPVRQSKDVWMRWRDVARTGRRFHNFISMLDFSIPCMATAVPSLSVRRR